MIYWHWQASADQPDLARGVCPPGLLGQAELAELARLTVHKRRREWLLGRWTAKQLLRRVVGEAPAGVALDALTIARNARGAPVGLAPGCPPWAISITHSHGRAACAAGREPGTVIGLDLDWVEPRSAVFVQDYLTTEELAWVGAVRSPPPRRDLAVMAIWCAKEAALKALQVGLTVDTRSVSVDLGWRDSGQDQWAPLAITVNAARLRQAAPALAGWWRTLEGWVLAIVSESETAQPGPPQSVVEAEWR